MRFFLLFIFMFLSASSYAEKVVFPGFDRDDYSAVLLQHVLKYNPKNNYQVQFYNKELPKSRVLKIIANNAGIDVISAGVTIER